MFDTSRSPIIETSRELCHKSRSMAHKSKQKGRRSVPRNCNCGVEMSIGRSYVRIETLDVLSHESYGVTRRWGGVLCAFRPELQ